VELILGGRKVLTAQRAAIMAVLNITPDSFSDGGRYLDPGCAVDRAAELVAGGADILDIGGESTRPGAAPVSADEELERVIPVLEALHARFDVPVSVDTSKAVVMHAAVAAGAAMINDVCALRGEGALAAAAACDVPVCLMHMLGEPRTMQQDPHYGDVVAEVRDFLAARLAACNAAGIATDRIVLDPGFGFGKTREHNFRLLNELEALRIAGRPLLAGLSRKSMIGQTLGLEVGERVHASLGLALLAVFNGANIVRVHDVRETRDALRMVEAVLNSEASG